MWRLSSPGAGANDVKLLLAHPPPTLPGCTVQTDGKLAVLQHALRLFLRLPRPSCVMLPATSLACSSTKAASLSEKAVS